ncbi:MAG: TolC family protein [Bacteroidota bacterium]|nr:TolC family protein [Bacteroidota bacterium]
MNRKIILIISLSILITVSALSQEVTTQPLRLEDAIQVAMKHNPELKTAHLEVERSDAKVNEAWGYALPSFDLSGRYTRTLKSPIFFANFGGQPTSIRIGMDHALDMALTGRQILFNGAVIVGVGAAKVYSKLARDIYFSKQVETVTKVRKAYYSALLAREVVEMMHTSLRNTENNLKNVLLMRKQGIISEYDELRASVQVENLRPTVIQSENNYELALDALRNTIGVDKNANYKIIDSLQFEAIDDSVISRAEELVQDSNPNLRTINGQIELNDAVIWAERSNYLPTIAAFGQYQYQSAKNDLNFSWHDLIGSSQVGLSISMNLFQGLQTRARVEQAQVEKLKTEEQKISLERTLKTGAHSVVGNLRQARKRIEAQEKTVETAEKGYKIVTTRFLANAATQLEVNDAEFALTQAKVNRIQAIYDYLIAAADLDQLTGHLPDFVDETKE